MHLTVEGVSLPLLTAKVICVYLTFRLLFLSISDYQT